MISTVLTAPGTSQTLARLARALGKTPVQVSDPACAARLFDWLCHLR